MMIDGPNTPVKSGTQPVVTPSRASKRNACVGDQDSLQRAAKLKAKRNLEESTKQGNSSSVNSFSALDNSVIAAKFSSLGVCLDVSNFSCSEQLDCLKSVEKDMLSCAKRSEVEKNWESVSLLLDDSDELWGDDIDILALNHICGEMAEGPSDGDCGGSEDTRAQHQWGKIGKEIRN